MTTIKIQMTISVEDDTNLDNYDWIYNSIEEQLSDDEQITEYSREVSHEAS